MNMPGLRVWSMIALDRGDKPRSISAGQRPLEPGGDDDMVRIGRV